MGNQLNEIKMQNLNILSLTKEEIPNHCFELDKLTKKELLHILEIFKSIYGHPELMVINHTFVLWYGKGKQVLDDYIKKNKLEGKYQGRCFFSFYGIA